MVRLKNIQFHDSLAEADYYPEGGLVKGHIVVDLESKEICSFERAGDFGDSYLGHARARLVEMYKEGSTRKECLIMWY